MYLSLFIFTFLITFLLIPFIKKIGLRYKFLDFPDKRKTNFHIPKVRIGGLAFYISYLISLAFFIIFFYFKKDFLIDKELFSLIVITSSGYFAIGFADDKFSLSPISRLFLQYFLATLISIKGLAISTVDLSFLDFPFKSIEIPRLASIVITSTWIVGIINAINWIDGMDGLAAGCSFIMFITLFFISYLNNQLFLGVIAIIFSAICLGFLKYNFKPAKILMGDGGSYLLGFSISYLTILSSNDLNQGLDIRVPLLVLLYPILDMIVVIFNRLKNKLPPIYPDKSHLHHRIFKISNNETLTVSILYFITILPCIFLLLIV